MTQDIEQRTAEWYAARCGSLGASALGDMMAKTKDGKPAASRSNLRAKLVIERLTGVQEDSFKSAAMQHGIDMEDAARMAYEARTGVFVTQTGLHTHPEISGTHASPDGLVGDEGLVEIKCPNSATHIDTLKSKKVPTKYLYQMQWQMRCTDRLWCDFVSFDDRLPENLQLFMVRIHRDDEHIATLEAEVRKFLTEVEADVLALQAMEMADD